MSMTNRTTPTDVSPATRAVFREEAGQTSGQGEDYLGVDRTIPGQAFVCLSFLSPEAAIKQRHSFYMEHFLRFLAQKVDAPPEANLPYTTNLERLVHDGISYDNTHEEWENFIYKNGEKLSQAFEEKTGGQTSLRGLKVRGVFATHSEAKHHSDRLAEYDKSHNVYIGQVGYWLPWDPNPAEVSEQEYQNKELNQLMKKYEENLAYKDKFYEERKREKVREGLERNDKLRKENEETKSTPPPDAGTPAPAAPAAASVRSPEETMADLEKLRRIVREKNKLMSDQQASAAEPVATAPVAAAPAAKAAVARKRAPRKAKAVDDRVAEDERLIKAAAGRKKAPEMTVAKLREQKKQNASSVPAAANDGDGVDVSAVFTAEDPWLSRKEEAKRNGGSA